MVVGMWEVSGDVIKMKSRRPAGTEPVWSLIESDPMTLPGSIA